MIARETVYRALYALVTPLLAPGASLGGPCDNQQPGTRTATQPFSCISREVIEVQRVPPSLQPVLFMDEAFEDAESGGYGLVGRKWTVYFHIGCTVPKGTPTSLVLNPLIDAVESAMQPEMGEEAQFLGLRDLIQNVQLSGMAFKNLGNNSTDPEARQAVCYLPVVITGSF